MFTKNIPSKPMENDLIRIRDANGVPALVKLRLPRPHERVRMSQVGRFSMSYHIKMAFDFSRGWGDVGACLTLSDCS